MEITMTNQQLGIYNWDRAGVLFPKNCRNPSSLHGFFISRRPIFGIALNTKSVNKSWVSSVTKPNCRTINALSNNGEYEDTRLANSTKILEKELKFQPTFDEYLKAMESVKTGREKTPIRDAKEYHPRKISTFKRHSMKPELEGNEEKFKLSLEGNSDQVETTESVERDELSERSSIPVDPEGTNRGSKLGIRERGTRMLKEKSKRGIKVGLSEKGGLRTWVSGQRKLNYGESNMSLKVERGTAKDGEHRSSERRNVRWMKDQDSSEEQKMENSGLSRNRKSIWVNKSYGEFDGVKSLTSNEDEGGGEFGQNGHTTQMQKKQLIQNRTQGTARVSIRDGSMDFSHISKGGSEKINWYRSNRERNLVDYKINQRPSDKKKLYGSEVEIERKSDEGMGNLEKHVSDFQTKMEHTDITTERGKPYENRNPVRLMNIYGIENHGPRYTVSDSRLESGHIQVDSRRKPSLNSGKSTRDGMVSMNDVDKSGHEMERAAFASFEKFTDIRGMPRVSRKEMEERIQKLAKWLNGADINLPEWMFSKTMRSARIKFTDSSILRVIQVLGAYGNWRRVLQVIEWLQSRERFKSYKSRYIYTTALNVLGKAKRPVESLNVFHSMRQELSSYPDLAAYHCIAVTLGQAGYMKELLDVIDCMRSPPAKKFNTRLFNEWDPRLEPDVVVYNAVLNACVRRKQWEGAFWVLQQLKQRSLQPTSTTYGLVMEVMFSCAKYNLVHEFFRKVEISSIPNSLNYRVLVNTLWREGKTDEAVIAVQDMERRGIVGSASLYYDLACCLCSAGRCQDALMQIDKICKVANKPLIVTYTGLIQACLDSGSVQNGTYIFEQMQRFCSPNIVTCNIMLNGYLEHGMFEEAKDLFKKMLDNSSQISSKADCKEMVLPDNYTFNSMLDACVSEKKWDDFSYVYQCMLHHGYHFNAKRHLRMLLEACRAGKGELLETTWKHLVQADRTPPAPLVKERFCMKLEENNYAGAISCITIPQKSELHSFSEKLWSDLFKANENRFQRDTLIKLLHEVSNIVAGSDCPRPIFQNLITSCREFIKTQMTVADINPIPNERTLLLELDTKS